MFKKDKSNIQVQDMVDKSPIRLENLQEGSRNYFPFIYLFLMLSADGIYLLPADVLEQHDKRLEDLLN